MVYLLDKDIIGFPDPHLADEDDGLLAIGGDLTPEWLLTAYSHGIFPWFSYKDQPICWHCPQDRFVIFPDEIHISHSIRQLINKGLYKITFNKAFNEVIEGCGKAQGRNEMVGAWLGGKMIPAYKKLHELGYAASVEVWSKDKNGDVQPADGLVGGLYGVTIGKNFFGESMFSLAPSASKLALIALATAMQSVGGIIDCQFETPHLLSMGGRHILYDEYMEIITNKHNKL